MQIISTKVVGFKTLNSDYCIQGNLWKDISMSIWLHNIAKPLCRIQAMQDLSWNYAPYMPKMPTIMPLSWYLSKLREANCLGAWGVDQLLPIITCKEDPTKVGGPTCMVMVILRKSCMNLVTYRVPLPNNYLLPSSFRKGSNRGVFSSVMFLAYITDCFGSQLHTF